MKNKNKIKELKIVLQYDAYESEEEFPDEEYFGGDHDHIYLYGDGNIIAIYGDDYHDKGTAKIDGIVDNLRAEGRFSGKVIYEEKVVRATRVPGGWIYKNDNPRLSVSECVFIPVPKLSK